MDGPKSVLGVTGADSVVIALMGLEAMGFSTKYESKTGSTSTACGSGTEKPAKNNANGKLSRRYTRLAPKNVNRLKQRR